jgi:pilus assembly protein Flp/PilA
MALKMQLPSSGVGFPAPPELDHTKGHNQMKKVFMRLWKEEEGQDLTEYALLLALIAVTLIAFLNTLALAIQGVFTKASTALT